jgi:hypothetical protein
MSSSRSGQCMPSPSPISRQFERSAWLPWARRGYHVSGTVIVRPSTRSTISASSVSDTCRARASATSIGDDEVFIPFPQKWLRVLQHEPFEFPELRGPKPAAAGKPNRVEPELGPVSVSLHVNVRWLVPVSRVKEEPIRALPKNGRHKQV